MVLPGQTGPWSHAPGSPRPDHAHFPNTRHIGLKTKKIQHLTKKFIQILICQRREERINVILLLSFVLEKRAQEKLAGAQAAALPWPCRGLKEGQRHTPPPLTRMFGSHKAEDSQGKAHEQRGTHTRKQSACKNPAFPAPA